MTIKMPPLWQQCLIFWAILCLVIIGYTDTLPSLLGISDYLMTFHTAGYIAAHGLWSALYPPAGSTGFAGAPFDQIAHRILSFMPPSSVGEYMYMPASAFIFAPLSLLAPTISMVAWQLTSLAAAVVGIYLCLEASEAKILTRGKKLLATMTALGASFGFLPFTMTVWIGQVGLVFGLLPLAVGFYLLKKERPLGAGLVFALLCLKPQMLVPALFLITYQLARKNWLPLAGLCAGACALGLLNLLVMGQSLCTSWLACLALSDKIYSDAGHGVAVHLATSMPRAILLSQAVSAHGGIKPLVYAAAGLLLLAGLIVTVYLARQKHLPPQTGLVLTFVTGSLALPVVVPHLFVYDLGALVPAALPLFITEDAPKSIKIIAAVFIACTDLYCLLVVADKSLAKPLLLVAVMVLCYLAALVAASAQSCNIVGKKQ